MNLLKNLKAKDLLNKTIFIRVDFNAPLQQNAPGRFIVTDDERIRRFLDTTFNKIHELTQGNCRIIIGSHLGRPHKELDHTDWDGIFNLQFVCSHFETLLKKEYEDYYIVFPPESMGSQLNQSIDIVKKNRLPLGGIKFLPNLRYLLEKESSYREEFIEELANVCDVYINCAFGTCHRTTRSITTLPNLMKQKNKPYVAGMLLEEELSQLGELAKRILKHPEQTIFIAGGSKVSDKIGIIKKFILSEISCILLGGKMLNIFLIARDLKDNAEEIPIKLKPKTGEEENFREEIKLAVDILEVAKEKGVKIVFPVDYKVAQDFHSLDYKLSDCPNFEEELQFDIGPKTIQKYSEILMGKNVQNVFWNGPLGAFDHPKNKGYLEGSVEIAKCLLKKCVRNKDPLAVIGGGDSAAIVKKLDYSSVINEFAKELNKMIPNNINHDLFEFKFFEKDFHTFLNYFVKNFFISTGGGAALVFLESYLKHKGQLPLSNYLPGTKALL